MNWQDDIADSFPEPRDDEPGSLRRDIADELADHLVCSFNRELHFTQDEKTAVRRVVDRFGDPRKIARKLWFDSMKDQLMSQRIALTTAIVSALASIAACVIVYLGMQQSAVAIQSIVAQSAEANAALLSRLEEFSKKVPAVTSANPEWNSVTARLTQIEHSNQPATEARFRLTGNSDRTRDVSFEARSDQNGVVDCGLLPFGKYTVVIESRSGEQMFQPVSVVAGRPTELKFSCPTIAPEPADFKMQMDWPADLKAKGFRAHVLIQRSGRHLVGQPWWYRQLEPKYHLVLTADQRLINLTGIESEGTFNPAAMQLDSQLGKYEAVSSIPLPAGSYRLLQMELFGPERIQDGEKMPYWIPVPCGDDANHDLAATKNWDDGGMMLDFPGGGSLGSAGGGMVGGGGGGGFFSVPSTGVLSLMAETVPLQFGGGGAGPGAEGVDRAAFPSPLTYSHGPHGEQDWVINLSESFLAKVRMQLAEIDEKPAAAAPKTDSPAPSETKAATK